MLYSLKIHFRGKREKQFLSAVLYVKNGTSVCVCVSYFTQTPKAKKNKCIKSIKMHYILGPYIFFFLRLIFMLVKHPPSPKHKDMITPEI